MIVVALTDPMRDLSKFDEYALWVKRWIPEVEVRRLSHRSANGAELAVCRGLILTGGGDVHPRFYGEAAASGLATETDEKRDLFEFGIIQDALKYRLPVLGICRGSQIFNVAMGGSLLPDIERAGYPSHKRGDAEERLHPVNVEHGTLLHAIVGSGSGDINTSHHQAVDRPGKGLRVSARSDDGIAEALEWESPGQPFLLLVQWHPERLKNAGSPFSRGVIERFSKELKQDTEVTNT